MIFTYYSTVKGNPICQFVCRGGNNLSDFPNQICTNQLIKLCNCACTYIYRELCMFTDLMLTDT